jgi:hypothetical protein
MMTKTVKAVIFFINMRITLKHILCQLLAAYGIMALCACGANKEEIPVIPPVTSPLSRDYIGFGVVTSSFTHITDEPSQDSRDLGYLRRSSLVKIIRRQTIRTEGGFTSWVFIDGNLQGWLREDVMEIYESEDQARTASESMSK